MQSFYQAFTVDNPVKSFFTKLTLVLIFAAGVVSPLKAQKVIETFDSYWSTDQIVSKPHTYGPFVYDTDGLLETLPGPNALSMSSGTPGTFFSIKSASGNPFQLIDLAMDCEGPLAPVNATVTGYRVGIPVTTGVPITILGNPNDFDFTAQAGFNNVDEVRITGTNLTLFLEGWAYDLLLPTTINSITKANTSPTNALSVNYTVNFSSPIGGLTTSNFAVAAGSIGDASITGVTGTGNTWTVAVNTGTGNGTIGLNLVNADGTSGITNSLPFVGEVYTINKSVPLISTTGSLSALSTISGTASSSGSFNVSGDNLTAGILVTPPAGFEVSKDNSAFSSTVTVGTAGTIASTPVYVRLKAADATNTYSGNIVLSSSGASSVNVVIPVSTVNAAPPAPVISYGGPQNFIVNTAITALTPVNSGGAVTPNDYLSPKVVIASGLNTPNGIAVDAAGNIYVTQLPATVSKLAAGGGSPVTLSSAFNFPIALAVDAAGDVYAMDSGNVAVRKIPAGGGTPVAVVTGIGQPGGIALDAAGNLYLSNGNIFEESAGGGAPFIVGSGFSSPAGLAIDASGNLYVVDAGHGLIKKIPAGGGAPVTLSSAITFPGNIALDAAGNSFVTDTGKVWELPAGGGSPKLLASGASPGGIATDAQGNLYYASLGHGTITKIAPDGDYYITPTLPAGLTFDGTTGVISGTPTAASPATDYKITAYNKGGSNTATVNIAVAGLTPIISNTGTLSALTTTNGTASATTTFSVSATNATAGIQVTPPAGFEVSASPASGFGNAVTIGAAGTIASTPVYIRLAATATAGIYSGNIVLSSAGAASVNVAMPPSIVNGVPPVITSFSPASGPVGTTVTITGTGFNTTAANNIVFFGATMAQVSAATATSLTVTVPLGATYQPITVLNGDTKLTGWSAKPFVTSFTPTKGSIAAADFSSQPNLPASTTGAQQVLISDLDGDGKADLVVLKGGSLVSLFRNTSVTGAVNAFSFADEVDFATAGDTRGIAIADMNGDGKPDLVMTLISQRIITVWLNNSVNGTISFAAPIDFTTGSGDLNEPDYLAVGDLDGDGKPDIAVGMPHNIALFHNVSSEGIFDASSLARGVDLTAKAFPEAIIMGDLDGDGKRDLITVITSNHSVSIWRNTMATAGPFTAASFAARVDFATADNSSFNIAMADLDGDGKPDLAVANLLTNSISVWRNTATAGTIDQASLAARVDFAAGNQPFTLVMGDLDGDGKADIAAVNRNDGTISIFRNNATPGAINSSSFAPAVNLTVGGDPQGIAIGDFDSDGKSDLVTSNAFSNYLSLFRNNPQPVIMATGTLTALTTTYGSASSSGSFNVSGIVMQAGILVTPPPGFEVSTNNTTFSPTVTVGTSGTFSSTPVYIRLASLQAAGNYQGNIVLSSPGANNVNVTTAPSLINREPLTLRAGNRSKTYGSILTGGLSATGYYIASGVLKYGNTISAVTIAYGTGSVSTDDAGTYPGQITPSAATGGNGFLISNYKITYVNGDIIVNPRALSIAANNINKPFATVLTGGTGSTAFTIKNGGLQNGNTISSVTIAYGAGSAAGDAVGTYTASVTPSAAVGANGFISGNYAITYAKGNIIVSKAIITTLGTVAALTTMQGSPSASASIHIAGTHMTAGILVTAPAGFEVSTDDVTYSNSVTMGGAGTIASAPLYVRLAATDAVNTYSGTLVLSSPGAANVNKAIPLSTVHPLLPLPTQQAQQVVFTNTNTTTTTVSWINGTGAGRVAFILLGSNGSALPGNGTPYTASTTFGAGTQIGSTGWYCIYNGTGSSVNVSGLSPGTTYRITVLEYNGTPADAAYLEGNLPPGAPNFIQTRVSPANVTTTSMYPVLPARLITFSNTTATGTTATWANGDGTARAVFMELTGTGSVVLTDGTTYTANTSFGAGSVVVMSGKPFYCVYNGTGNTVNITGLSPNTLYRLAVVEYKGGAGSEKYLNTGQSPANVTTGSPPLNTLNIPKEQTRSAVPLVSVIGNEKVEANNILSPNGDGINDIWVVKNIAFYPNNTVAVYNRAGSVVFTKKGYANDWDGTYRGSVLAEGTYYYLVDLGNGTNIKGFITVVMDR